MLKTQVGETFKLESPTGTLLGMVTIPARWSDYLQENQSVQFSLAPQLPSGNWSLNENFSFTVKQGILSRSYGHRDTLTLWGVTLEEFERIEGCYFSPSAAYLRSIVG